MAGGIEMSHMHEKSRDKRLPDVDVVVFAGEFSACERQIEASHQACQLLAHTVAGLKTSCVQEIVVCPSLVLAIAL
jgi:hypothetical protein